MLHTAVQIAQATTEHTNEPIAPLTLALITFSSLMAVLMFTFAFRNINHRHAEPVKARSEASH